jgi:hypothetical protein
VTLSEADRDLLRAVMDRLIPPVDFLPGAGTMGLADEVAKLMAAHGRYGSAVLSILGALRVSGAFGSTDGARRDAAIHAAEIALPQHFAHLIEAVYTVYYSRPEVHARVGWRTGPLQPAGFDLPPFNEDVLATARKRAPFWRKA